MSADVFSGGVFFRETLDVAVPVDVAQQRLARFLDSAAGSEAGRAALAAGRAVTACSDSTAAAGLAARIATVPARRRGPGIVVPMQWRAGSPARQMPVVLDADVEVQPTIDGASRITVTGSFRGRPRSAGSAVEGSKRGTMAAAVVGVFMRSLAQSVASPPEADRPTAQPIADAAHPSTGSDEQ